METLAIGLFCLAPLGLFAAGWAACYLLVVKYRLRFDRRPDDLPSRNVGRQAGKDPAWTP